MVEFAGPRFAIAALLVTVLTLFARYHWLADLLANLRIQQLIGFSFLLIGSVISRQLRPALIIVACCLFHLAAMSGNLILRKQPATSRSATEPQDTFQVMTINVLTQNQQHDRIIEHLLVASPDVIAVLELGTALENALNAALAETHPFQLTNGLDRGNFGIALYSKHPLENGEVFYLNEPIASIEATIKGYRVIATHPLPPMGASRFASRNEHLSLLADRVSSNGDSSYVGSTILMGDLNLTPWSPFFSELLNNTGLHRARCGVAVQPTWYAKGSAFPFGLVLDHVLIGDHLTCTEHHVGEAIGSDHRSVTVTLQRRSESK